MYWVFLVPIFEAPDEPVLALYSLVGSYYAIESVQSRFYGP